MAKGKKNRPPAGTSGSPPPVATQSDSTEGPSGAGPATPAALGSQSDADEAHHLLYKGAAGQMAVMSEFLYRALNVAVPEVDVGNDIFVVRETDDEVTRVQVKYSKADGQLNGSYVTQFNLPWDQFDRPEDTPALVYVLAVRFKDHWTDFIVIRRSVLRQLLADHGIGTVSENDAGEPVALKLRLVFTTDDVTAKGGFSIKKYRDAFRPWPPSR